MADLLSPMPARPLNWVGEFCPGAQLTAFATGTTLAITLYQDRAGTVPHATPIVADQNGVFPPIFYSGDARVIVTDADGEMLPGFPIDPAPRSPVGMSGADGISFTPTFSVPENTVQEAIERVDANQEARLAAAGVAVTQAPLVANINFTEIASGRYRYDGTTTGTFPLDVTKADGGVLVVSAGATGNMHQSLIPRDGNKAFQRVLVALAWSAWDEVIVTYQGATRGAVVARGADNWEALPKGGEGQVLRATDVAAEWGGAMTSRTVDTTTGGTSFTFLVPATATRIEITSIGTSLSGTDNLLVQLGTGGAAVTTGYTSTSLRGSSSNTSSTAGFIVTLGDASAVLTGKMELTKHTGNRWLATHLAATTASGSDNVSGAGSVNLAGAIDRVVIKATGSDTFDAASLNVHFS